MTLNQSLKIDTLPKGLTHCVNDIKKSPKICFFPKGLTRAFYQKFEIFSSLFCLCFFFKVSLDKLFDCVQDRKKGSLDYKNEI